MDVRSLQGHVRELEGVLGRGEPREIRKILRYCVHKIRMAPERRQVEITYRVPEPFVIALVAGAGFEPATFGL